MKFDINDFRIKKEESLPVDVEPVVEAYGAEGGFVKPDDPFCVAYASNSGVGATLYKVRMATAGYRGGRFFNPLEEDRSALVQDGPAHGRPRYEFRKVAKSSFSAYINFLKTKNPAYLRVAERGE